MKQTWNYNIHNILKFKIMKEKRRLDLIRDINLPLSFFEVEQIDEPDIILNIGKFTPFNNECYLIDHNKYYVKENYLYVDDSAGRAK